jgi:hypothetical protein
MSETMATSSGRRRERSRRYGLTRLAAAACTLALALSGCATEVAYLSTGPSQREPRTFGGQSYEVGPVTVLIRPQQEVEMICLLRGGRVSATARIHGCYVSGERLIVSTADPYVLLHEFKHHFEGAWHK